MPFIKQLDVQNWTKGVARPVAYTRKLPKDLSIELGIQFEYGEESGLGEMEMALLETHSGKHFGLIRYPQAPAEAAVNRINGDVELRQ